MEDLVPSVRLARLLDGFLTTQLIYTAARLRLDEVLAEGPQTGAAVAAAVGADPAMLGQVLRGLVSVEVLDEDDQGRFLLTPIGAALAPMRSAALVRGDLYYAAAAALPDCVLEGGVAFRRTYGTDFFSHLGAHPDVAATFQRAMGERSDGEIRDVLAAYDFVELGSVVDVGGGEGRLLAAILQQVPGLTGILFDRDVAVQSAVRTFAAAGLTERTQCVVGDFFDRMPVGHDGYLLSRVLHDWSDEDARRILRCCRHAIATDGRLIVVDALLPDRVADGRDAIRMDLHMMVLFGSRERTEAEFAALLADTGFTLRRVSLTSSPTRLAVLEATPT
jgi:SAM-dependent methyltransferase